jgi:hypothetical protein
VVEEMEQIGHVSIGGLGEPNRAAAVGAGRRMCVGDVAG